MCQVTIFVFGLARRDNLHHERLSPMQKTANSMMIWILLAGLAGARPRLEAASNEWNGALKAGAPMGFQVRVVNRSKEISRGVVCSVLMQGRKLGQVVSNPDLAPNGEILLEGSVPLPSDLSESLQGKSPGQVLELQLQPYRVADLSPADIAVETTTEGMRWVVTVINKGAAPAPSIPYRLLWDGQPIHQKKLLQAVGPGESQQFTYLDKRPPERGKHKLACVVDPDGELEDADTANNQYQLDWQGASNRPDLSIGGWHMEPETAVVGEPVRIFFTLTNNGEVEMFKLPVQLKIDDKVEQDKKFFQSLPPGGEAELSFSWIPSEAGEHKLRLICQGQATPPRPIAVAGRPGYKLQLVSADIPKRSHQGKDWIFDVVLKNQGTLPCDSVKAVLWADGSRVWSARLSNPLPPGGEATLNLRWSAEQPGAHQLRIELTGQGAKADQEADVNKTYPVQVDAGQ